eukprot:gb/GECH01004404.1/.p1 GENE.gb/GECH01004404.1/~~gb/GECH01004404.1/.p1  ORF type:complete len:611 (+),score=181.98 gb/GECH01004404.1/:1-1833(+)
MSLDERVEKIQNSIGQLIERPRMRDNILRKLPVRFVVDTIVAIIKKTGYASGLYSEDEIQEVSSKKGAPREAKLNFFRKICLLVALTLNENVSCKPNNILRGKNVEDTLDFLYMLYRAAVHQESLNWKPAIDKVFRYMERKNQENHEQQHQQQQAPQRPQSRSAESAGSKPREPSSQEQSRDHHQPKTQTPEHQNRTHSGSSQHSRSDSAKRSRSDSAHSSDANGFKADEVNDKPIESRESNKQTRENYEKPHSSRKQSMPPSIPTDDTVEDDPEVTQFSTTRPDSSSSSSYPNSSRSVPARVNSSRPGSSRPPSNRAASAHSQPGSSSKSMDRPGSSRPGSSKPVSARKRPGSSRPTSTSSRPGSSRPGSSMKGRPGSPRPPSSKDDGRASGKVAPKAKDNLKPIANVEDTKTASGIIQDGEDNNDDEESVVVTKTQGPPSLNSPSNESSGKLTSSLMQANGQAETTISQHKTEQSEMSSGTGIILKRQKGAKKTSDKISGDVDQLRNALQTVSQKSTPLGKLLDFLQEDMEAMNRELEMWREKTEEHERELNNREQEAKKDVYQHDAQIQEIESQIENYKDKIAGIKSAVSQNDERIENLLNMATSTV